MFKSPFELLLDFSLNCSAIRTPLKGIYLRKYALRKLYPQLLLQPENGRLEAARFMIEMFGDMHKLWVRYACQGPLSELELRQQARKAIADQVLFPIIELAKFIDHVGLSGKEYREIGPLILAHIVCSSDFLSQTIIFDGIIKNIPVRIHKCNMDLMLEAIADFSHKVNLQETLQRLIDRIYPSNQAFLLTEEEHLEELEAINLLWAKLSQLIKVILEEEKNFVP